jgi:hypothetical protein
MVTVLLGPHPHRQPDPLKVTVPLSPGSVLVRTILPLTVAEHPLMVMVSFPPLPVKFPETVIGTVKLGGQH